MTELLLQQDAEVVHPMAVSNIALFFGNEGRTSNRRFGPHYLIGWLDELFSDGLKSPIPFLHSYKGQFLRLDPSLDMANLFIF